MKPIPSSIALVHYHLNGGGVTRIIEQQSRALTDLRIPHVVYCGENLSGCDIPHHIIPELQFSDQYDPTTSRAIIKKIETHSENHFGSKPQIFHFHNHSIGLNPHYGELVTHFAKAHHLLLQVHDFVEDGRSQNLKNIPSFDVLYPQASHIHYASINSRDVKLLESTRAKVNLLPNSFRPSKRKKVKAEKIIFYPIQALRRKNLGELLLIALLSPPDYQFAIGQTPAESKELADFWEETAQSLQLPILFNVCDRLEPCSGVKDDFNTWYEHSSHVVTTSIQEGFGMAFIEPVHFQKPLLGRNIPEITCDMENHGISFKQLYHQILVPHEWIEEKELPIESFSVENIRYYDFGNLPELEQKKLLLRLYKKPNDRSFILAKSPSFCVTLSEYLEKVLQDTTVQSEDVIEPWNHENLKNNLSNKYSELLSEALGPCNTLNYAAIKTYFDAQPFHFLKHSSLKLM